MATKDTTDIWDRLDNPSRGTGTYDYFGQVKVDTWFATLVKGVGKQPFDPAKDSIDKRVTSIDILIIPIAEQNLSFEISRNMIAESREWAGIVLPSIKALGLSARELNGRWVHAQTCPTGSTYVGKDGSTKDRTTFKFLAVFPDEASCRAAYQAYTAGAPAPVATQPAAAAPAPTNGGASKEKETALKFLKVIVENAARGQTDIGVIQRTAAANIASMPLVNKFFTADSPETLQMIAEAMSK